jgi:hypothetical protein
MKAVSRRRRAAVLVAVTAAVFTGMSVSPAVAGHADAGGAAICSALPLAGENTFGLTTVARGGSGARGEPGGMSGDATFVATPRGNQLLATTIPVYRAVGFFTQYRQ